MIDIPPEVVIKSSIKPGSVYYFPNEEFSSDEPHFFVVLNIAPASESVILLVCASSRIDKVKLRRRKLPKDTLILIKPSQYPIFKVDSIFDCNYVIEQTIDKLVQRLSNGELLLKTEMEIGLVEILRRGVQLSPLVSDRIKEQL